MATPILGPIENGVRIVFKVQFTVPASYAATDGDAVITDNLPSGFSLFTGIGAQNGVTIEGVDAGIIPVGTTSPAYTIPAASLNPTNTVIATFDAVITNAASLPENTDITNYSTVTFTAAPTGKYASGNANTTFQLTTTLTLQRTAPIIFINLFAPINYKYEFTASTINSTDAAPFKYFITDTFGDNHDLQYTGDPAVPTVSASYVNDVGSTVEILNINTKQSGKSYTFSFAHDPAFAGKKITLSYTATVSGLSLGLILVDKLTYSVGGAIGEEKEFDLTVSLG